MVYCIFFCRTASIFWSGNSTARNYLCLEGLLALMSRRIIFPFRSVKVSQIDAGRGTFSVLSLSCCRVSVVGELFVKYSLVSGRGAAVTERCECEVSHILICCIFLNAYAAFVALRSPMSPQNPRGHLDSHTNQTAKICIHQGLALYKVELIYNL